MPQQISIVQNNNGQIYKNTAHNTNLQQQQHQNQNQQPKQQLNVQKHQIQQANTLTTYTLPPKDGEFDSNVDDLEDFITATVVTTNRCQDSPGSPQSSVPSSSGASSSGFNIFSQLKIIDVNKPMLNMNIELQQQQQQQLQQAHSLVVLKKFEVNECESANMLVILDNGEQRLIKFKWSKEKFTVQELLYQVGIKVDIVSPMGFIKLDGMKLNYIATVGNCRSVQNIAAIIEAAENHLRQQ